MYPPLFDGKTTKFINFALLLSDSNRNSFQGKNLSSTIIPSFDFSIATSTLSLAFTLEIVLSIALLNMISATFSASSNLISGSTSSFQFGLNSDIIPANCTNL